MLPGIDIHPLFAKIFRLFDSQASFGLQLSVTCICLQNDVLQVKREKSIDRVVNRLHLSTLFTIKGTCKIKLKCKTILL